MALINHSDTNSSCKANRLTCQEELKTNIPALAVDACMSPSDSRHAGVLFPAHRSGDTDTLEDLRSARLDVLLRVLFEITSYQQHSELHSHHNYLARTLTV